MKVQASSAVEVSPEDWALALEGLKRYFIRFGDNIVKNYAARYSFALTDVREYGGDQTFRWEYEPLEMQKPFGPQQEGWRWKQGVFRAPTSRVVEEIPQNDAWAYRGMSWEEWREIRRSGFVGSKGTHNLGAQQKGLTFFSERADSARYYATGFAPVGYKPGKRRPGVVIAVPKEETLASNDREWRRAVARDSDSTTEGSYPDKLIPEGERASGPLPMSVIQAVWFAIPTEGQGGFLELTHRSDKRDAAALWTQGSSSGASIAHALIQVYPERML